MFLRLTREHELTGHLSDVTKFEEAQIIIYNAAMFIKLNHTKRRVNVPFV